MLFATYFVKNFDNIQVDYSDIHYYPSYTIEKLISNYSLSINQLYERVSSYKHEVEYISYLFDIN